MALWPLFSVADCIPYALWDGEVPVYEYNKYLVTPPRLYQESISNLKGFFYEPSNDYLVAYALLDIYSWPGWACVYYYWNANTGIYLGKGSVNIGSIAYANHPCMGGYNKIYTTRNDTTKIYEVPWNSLNPESGAWFIDPKTWNPATSFFYALLNRIDSLLCGISTWYLEIWDISAIPALKAKLRLPNTLGYLAYEDRKRAWVITKDGLIAKVNYQDCRWEMLSSVQDPSADAINYFCAFDTLRNRLAVLRQRPDAEDGACQCQLEFYRLIAKAAQLTQPVPVGPLETNAIVRFAANLIGTAGEGIASYAAQGALLIPASGKCLTPIVQAGSGGAVALNYKSTLECTDTLQISATITDGE